MTRAEFDQAWRTDASGALEQIIVGLGRFQGNVVGLSSVLDHLDQANVRNIITLGALANGIVDVNNEQTSLIAINNLSENAWRQNSAMQDVAERRSKTMAAQLQIMQNRLVQVANIIGARILPVMAFFVARIQDLLAGFSQLPGPLKFAIAAFAGILGVVSLLAGGLLALIGPLVLIMVSWRNLKKVLDDSRNAGLGTKGAIDALTGSVDAQTGAVLRNSAVWVQNRNAQGQFAKGGQWVAQTTNAAAGATTGLAAAAPLATKGLRGLWAGLNRVTRVAAVVTTLLSLGSIALTFFGNRARSAEKDVKAKVVADEALVDALEQVRKGNVHAADSYLLQKVAAANLLKDTERLRISYASIVQIIKGTAPPKFAADTVKHLKEAAAAGDKGATKILNFMATQRAEYKEAALAAGILSEARAELGDTNEDTAQTEADLAARTDEAREAQDKANQAAYSYIDAVFAQRRAVLATADAQEDYEKALRDAADPTQRLAEAENDLAIAREDHRKIQRDLAEAEQDLLTARADQIEELADAEDDLADANDRYIDSLSKIHDLEQEIADLRDGPSSKELLEATNKLANAHLRLREAERGVKDAEWQLQYLREEGASNRDIEDAEFALDKARQDVADETESLGEAEDELREIREGHPEEIIRLERDLARARRDSDRALEEVHDQEDAVRQLREDIGNDTAYLDAQAKVADIQNRQFDALRKIQDAEIELQRIRSGGLQEEITKAQLALEEALYAEARAATAVQKEQAAMRKDFWDSGREAHALADNLSLMLDQAPTPEARKRLLEYIDLLRQTVVQPEKKTPGGSTGPAPGVPTAGADTPGLAPIKPEQIKEAGKSIASRLRDAIVNAFSLFVGSMVGRIIMALVATFLGITGGWAILAGIIVGALVSWVLKKLLESKLGKKIIDGLIEGMKDVAGAVGRFFHSLWFDYMWPAIQEVFDLGSPSRKFEEIGKWLIEGLLLGMGQKLVDIILFFVTLPQTIVGLLADAGSWLVEKGGDIIGGLWRGAGDKWGEFWDWIGRIGGWIGDKFSDAWEWLKTAGRNVIGGFWNGVVEKWNEFRQWLGELPGKIWDVFSGDIQFSNWGVAGTNLVIGFWNGIASKSNWLFDKVWDFAKGIYNTVKDGLGKLWPFSPSEAGVDVGEGLGLGIMKGIKGALPGVLRSAEDFATQIEDAMRINPDLAAQFDDAEFRAMMAQHSLPALVGAGAPVTTNNNGDSINVEAHTDADPTEIAHAISWQQRVRRRG
jgi:hypothetical protein